MKGWTFEETDGYWFRMRMTALLAAGVFTAGCVYSVIVRNVAWGEAAVQWGGVYVPHLALWALIYSRWGEKVLAGMLILAIPVIIGLLIWVGMHLRWES